MKFKSYQGRSLAEVLPQIREELGADAVILKQRTLEQGGVGGFFAKRGVEVLAADRAPGTPQRAGAGAAAATLAERPAPAGTTDAGESREELLRQTFAAALAEHEAETETETEPAPTAATSEFAPLRLASAPETGGLRVTGAPRAAAAAAASAYGAPAQAAAPSPPARPPLAAARAAVAFAPPQVAAAPTATLHVAPVAPPPPGLADDEEAADIALELERAGVAPERALAVVAAARLHLAPFDRRPLRDLVRSAIAARIHVEHGWADDGAARRVAVIGPSGSGKSSAVANLAAAWASTGLSVGVIAIDAPAEDGWGARLGGDVDRALAYIAGAACLRVADSAEGARALLRLGQRDVVLIDTPGLGGRDEAAERLVGDTLAACQPHEVHVALPLGVATREADAILARTAHLGASRLLVTKTDEARFAGPLFDLADRSVLPLSYLASSRRIPGGLAPADGGSIAARILPI